MYPENENGHPDYSTVKGHPFRFTMTTLHTTPTPSKINTRGLRWNRRGRMAKAGRRRAARSAAAGGLGWADVSWARSCACGMAKSDVGIAWSQSGDCAYPATGVITCGSVWACPVCSAKIRRVRTSEVEQVAAWHAARGGSLVMVTLTLRHTRGDKLAALTNGLTSAYRRLQQSYGWTEGVRPLLDGQVRALEVTHSFAKGDGNGWHPHLHVLLLVQAGREAEVTDHLGSLLADTWGDLIVSELGEQYRPSEAVGYDVRPIGASAAKYVTKISLEVTRADLKSATRQPWSLIDNDQWERWGEYCAAMKGKRAVQFSRGLRDAAGLNTPDDDESACLLDLDEGVVVAYVERRKWNRHMNDGTALDLVEYVEERCRAVRNRYLHTADL